MNFFNPADLVTLLPELILVGFGLIVLVLDLFLPRERKRFNVYLTVLGFASSLVALWMLWPEQKTLAFSELMVVDGYAQFVKMVVLLASLLAVFISERYLVLEGIFVGEFFELLLFCSAGMMIMISANDLLTFYLGLELMSLTSYVLTAFLRHSFRSTEAGIKYFLLGSFSSALMLYGISLIYGMTGTTNLEHLGIALSSVQMSSYLIVAVVLLVAGFGFKVSAVPFHLWTPDVYTGAPTPVVAYMSVGTKAAGIAAFARFFLVGFGAFQATLWAGALVLMSAMSMVLGNVVALVQTNVKRMLAYSAIGHAGYMLVGLAVAVKDVSTTGELPDGLTALLFYLFAYLFANIGAFAIVIYVGREGQHENYEDFSGLSQTNPWLSAAMMLFLLSLTGIPPTVGFVGKFYLFGAAIEQGYVALALLGLLTSAISLYFYMGLAMYIYMRPPRGEQMFYPSRTLTLSLAVCAIATLWFGILPGDVAELARSGALDLLGALP